ncbi:hypothetical protein GCM10008018_53580 [Paenibacillus marchantiophytorum]|uniref:DUF4183 domain-containing protein n=1 Tax=Paenibacillus marchantiophytorum TaxID=1619310 RepID=A0ABQ1F741_9BACL|nr:DUF4183 domain-containing protein [Paenibacillus marchantiophytorum]GGA00556.1 hypothetical protein GCM10008018_53580 [Paenibacillus marchantiophytorum]
MLCRNTRKKKRRVPLTRKHVCKKSNSDGRKDCKKKTITVCPLPRKKGRKKMIVICKKNKRVACPSPKINVTAPQGIQGPQGLLGLQGVQGPLGIQGPPGLPGPSIIPEIIIVPSAQRYFYTIISDTQSLVTIPANEFTNDEGRFISAFIEVGQNSYSNLYINGMLQEGSLYSLNTNALTISANNQTIFSGTPIILEIIQFFAQTSS